MANFNKVILAGNLTRDVQVTFLPSGTPVGDFGMAINRKWRPADGGEMREEVTFVDCKLFGKGAETLQKHIGKGSPLMVDGRLKFDQWEAKEGGRRSKLYVIVEGFQFLGGGRGDNSGRQPRGERGDESQVPPEQDAAYQNYPDDEVPF